MNRSIAGAVIRVSGVFAAVLALLAAGPAAGRRDSPPACAGPAYRQFDFFVGDWDAYDVTAPDSVVARNRVTLELGDCVVHESYRQNDGLAGESYSLYDASRGVWHQTWVTNRGGLLLLEGALRGDSMVLTAPERSAGGATSLMRVVWYREAGGVRETATRSADGGHGWRPVFDMRFLPHRAPGTGRRATPGRKPT